VEAGGTDSRIYEIESGPRQARGQLPAHQVAPARHLRDRAAHEDHASVFALLKAAPRVAQSSAQLKVLAPVRCQAGAGDALHPRRVAQDEIDDAIRIVQREMVAIETVRQAGIA
jgi:hypothetical protein